MCFDITMAVFCLAIAKVINLNKLGSTSTIFASITFHVLKINVLESLVLKIIQLLQKLEYFEFGYVSNYVHIYMEIIITESFYLQKISF